MQKIDLFLNVVTGTDPNDAIREVFVSGNKFADVTFPITTEDDVFHLVVMEKDEKHNIGMFRGNVDYEFNITSERERKLMDEVFPGYRYVGVCEFIAPWACRSVRMGLTWKFVSYQRWGNGSYCLLNSKPCDYTMNWESAKHPATS